LQQCFIIQSKLHGQIVNSHLNGLLATFKVAPCKLGRLYCQPPQSLGRPKLLGAACGRCSLCFYTRFQLLVSSARLWSHFTQEHAKTLILLVIIQSYIAIAGRHFQVCPAEGRLAQTSQVSRLQLPHLICLRQAFALHTKQCSSTRR